MSKIIGIDLGTTNSCVSVMEGNNVVVIANREGSRTTPSIVAFSNTGDTLVGQMAKRQAAKNPKNTVFAVKRLIGRTIDDPEVVRLKSLVPFDIVPMGSGERKTPGVKIGDKEYSPQEISALILSQMRDIAEDYVGEKIEQAVITVPANFNDAQRQATRDAGRIAGLDVLRVINEPTAASLGYGFGEDRHETIVVYDLGGGTFDISILRLGDGMYEVLSTVGDPFLGGEDFDNRIVETLLSEFQDENGIDLHSDMSAMYRIKEAAECAKQELSVARETEINLPFLTIKDGAPLHMSRTITRTELEDLTRDIVEKTIPICQQALDDAQLTAKDITQVVLVGGMTLPERVPEYLRTRSRTRSTILQYPHQYRRQPRRNRLDRRIRPSRRPQRRCPRSRPHGRHPTIARHRNNGRRLHASHSSQYPHSMRSLGNLLHHRRLPRNGQRPRSARRTRTR